MGWNCQLYHLVWPILDFFSLISFVFAFQFTVVAKEFLPRGSPFLLLFVDHLPIAAQNSHIRLVFRRARNLIMAKAVLFILLHYMVNPVQITLQQQFQNPHTTTRYTYLFFFVSCCSIVSMILWVLTHGLIHFDQYQNLSFWHVTQPI